ncbi:MAG: hypothetical protein OXI66_13030 [Boseongicola sp.]|nr:hypothetical protein [Boseongicola sp.]
MTKILTTISFIAIASTATAEHLYNPSKIKTREQAAAAGSHVLQDWLTDNSSEWDDVVRRCTNRVSSSDMTMQYKCYAYVRELSDRVSKAVTEKGLEFDSRQHLMIWIGIANSIDNQLAAP